MTAFDSGFWLAFILVIGPILWLAFRGADPEASPAVQQTAGCFFDGVGILLLTGIILFVLFAALGLGVQP